MEARSARLERERGVLKRREESLVEKEKQLDETVATLEKGLDAKKEKELKKRTKETKTQLKRAEEEVEECMIQRARVRRETMVLEKEKERKRREVETRTEARGACEKALAWLEWEEDWRDDLSRRSEVKAKCRSVEKSCEEKRQRLEECCSLIDALKRKQHPSILRQLREEEEERETLQTGFERIKEDLERCEDACEAARKERLERVRAAVQKINKEMSSLFMEITFSISCPPPLCCLTPRRLLHQGPFRLRYHLLRGHRVSCMCVCGTVSVVQAGSHALDLLLAPLGRAAGAVSAVLRARHQHRVRRTVVKPSAVAVSHPAGGRDRRRSRRGQGEQSVGRADAPHDRQPHADPDHHAQAGHHRRRGKWL